MAGVQIPLILPKAVSVPNHNAENCESMKKACKHSLLFASDALTRIGFEDPFSSEFCSNWQKIDWPLVSRAKSFLFFKNR
jgi:hypothetical protein